MSKEFLTESQVRRFQTLASVPSIQEMDEKPPENERPPFPEPEEVVTTLQEYAQSMLAHWGNTSEIEFDIATNKSNPSALSVVGQVSLHFPEFAQRKWNIPDKNRLERDIEFLADGFPPLSYRTPFSLHFGYREGLNVIITLQCRECLNSGGRTDVSAYAAKDFIGETIDTWGGEVYEDLYSEIQDLIYPTTENTTDREGRFG